jgi:hypothetical protein
VTAFEVKIGEDRYHIYEPVRLLEEESPHVWLGAIEYSEATLKRAPHVAYKQGTILRLDILNIGIPFREIMLGCTDA